MKTKISFLVSNGLLFLAFLLQLILLALPSFYSLEKGCLGFDSVNYLIINTFTIVLLILVIGGISLMRIPISTKKECIKNNRFYGLWFLLSGILTGVSMLIHKEGSFFAAANMALIIFSSFATTVLAIEFFLLDFENNLSQGVSTNIIKQKRHYLLGGVFVVFLLLLVLNSVVSSVSIDGKLHVFLTLLSALLPLIVAWLAFYTSLFIKVYKISSNLGVFNLDLEKKVFNYAGFISLAICLGVLASNVSVILWLVLYAVSALFFLELGRRNVKKFIVE